MNEILPCLRLAKKTSIEIIKLELTDVSMSFSLSFLR